MKKGPVMLSRFRRPGSSDSGVTLVIAMMVMGVVSTLAVVVITVAIQANQDAGRDRQRTVTVNAAEAGVDAAYAQIQASGTTLPCRWPATGTSSVQSAPDTATALATISYFNSAGAAMPCTSGTLSASSVKPATAIVDGYGNAQAIAGRAAKERHMQALVNLTPVYGESLNKAIFADSSLSFNNQTTLVGNSGPDADVYTNGNFVCANNQNFAGSVLAQGSISITGTCTIAGDAWAKLDVSNSSGSNGSIGGRVLSSTGAISLPNNFNVNGTLLAAGSITWDGCSANGKCFPNTTVVAPQSFPFPILRGDAATMDAWRAEGYTVFYDNNCATIKSNVINVYAKKGSKTLLNTSCAVNFAGDKSIPLSNDLAIFAYGGFSSSQQVSFESNNATMRNLHWVVPADAVTSRPCATPGVTTDNQFNFAATVNMLVYSPCNISFANNADHLGQVFGGSAVAINNQFTMQFRPVPVWGVDPTSLPLLSYKIDVVYKRETR
jgi:Tfp pilus assembly protein PilX